MKCTVALAQTDSVPGDLRRNVSKHLGYISKAAAGGADLVVFPELSLTGYTVKDAAQEIAVSIGSRDLLEELAVASRDIMIIAGGIEESREFGFYNSAFLFHQGTFAPVHRKVYPPTYGMFEENRYFLQGKSVSAFETPYGRIGVLICEDLWHVPLPYLLAKDGADMIVGLSASPTRLSADKESLRSAEVNYEQHRSLARLLSVYLLFCNRVGFEDGVNFWGGSELVSPVGETMARAKLFEEDLMFAEVDFDEVRRARQMSRHFLDDDPYLVARELQRIVSKNPMESR